MFTIGADPELFLRDTSTNKLISAIGLIGGSKDSPFPIGNGCAIQEDNVAAEFCIPPCNNTEEFIASISYSLKELERRANVFGLSLANNIASASFDPDQLEMYQAQVFGCDPDFNAYTGEMNPRPKANDPNLRSCGGHVHIGTKYDERTTIKVMDLFLGIPSVVLDPDTDRRALYGKPGAFRYKSYGVEYRTLSNFWIWDNKLITWVYNQVKSGLEFMKEGFITSEKLEAELQYCINSNDRKLADKLILDFNLQLP